MSAGIPLRDLFEQGGIRDWDGMVNFAVAATGRCLTTPRDWSALDFDTVCRALVDGIGEDKCERPS